MLSYLISLFILQGFAQSPDQYEKKSYTKESSQKVGDSLFFEYGFKDHLGAYREFKWNINALDAESFLHGFGLSEKHGDSFQVGSAELQYSMMKNIDGKIHFDYEKIVEESKPLIGPLYLKFKAIVEKHQFAPREKVELVMRFLQDIPYGIPPTNYKGRYIAGLFPPIETLSNTWGDCDSKSLLMATLLSFDPTLYDKLAIILVPGHALIGIKMVPGPYDKFVTFNGVPYIYAEPVGLARTPMGMTNSPYSNSISVIPLNLFPPIEPKSTAKPEASFGTPCPDNGLSVEYDHPFNGEKIKSCQIKVNGKYLKHGPTKYFSTSGEFLREENYGQGELL